jgi:Zn-dependent peptidase ImmA (M78 family)
MAKRSAIVPERIGGELRALLQLKPADPLDPVALATHLNIAVLTLDEIHGLPAWAYEQLLDKQPAAWSAATLVSDSRAVILINHRHTLERKRATLMEEIAHVWLGHRPSRVGRPGTLTTRTYEGSQERQAFATGSAALVPREGLMAFVREGEQLSEIARAYGVSRELVAYRLKCTGLWFTAVANSTTEQIPLL